MPVIVDGQRLGRDLGHHGAGASPLPRRRRALPGGHRRAAGGVIARAELFSDVTRLAYEDPLTGLGEPAGAGGEARRGDRAVARGGHARRPHALRPRRAEDDQRHPRPPRRRPRAAARRRGAGGRRVRISVRRDRPARRRRVRRDPAGARGRGGPRPRHHRAAACSRRTATRPIAISCGAVEAGPGLEYAGPAAAGRRLGPVRREAPGRGPGVHGRGQCAARVRRAARTGQAARPRGAAGHHQPPGARAARRRAARPRHARPARGHGRALRRGRSTPPPGRSPSRSTARPRSARSRPPTTATGACEASASGLGDEVYELEEFPATAGWCETGAGSFLIDRHDRDADPAERELLAELGFSGVLAAATLGRRRRVAARDLRGRRHGRSRRWPTCGSS